MFKTHWKKWAIGAGVYISVCGIYQTITRVHVIAPHHWGTMGGQRQSGKKISIIRSPLDRENYSHIEYVPTRFHILNPFQYFAWLECKKVAKESSYLYYKYDNPNCTETADFHDHTDMTSVLDHDIQLPVKYDIRGFRALLGGGSVIITSIKPIYASSKTLNKLSIWECHNGKTDAVGNIDEKTGKKWLFKPLGNTLRGGGIPSGYYENYGYDEEDD